MMLRVKQSTIFWIALFIILFITTFSTQVFFIFLCIILFFITGCFVSLYCNISKIKQDYVIFQSCGQLQLIDDEDLNLKNYLSSYLESVKKSDIAFDLNDASFTGEKIIDEQIHDVIRLAYRDYIQNWYNYVSPHQQFPSELKKYTQTVIKSISQRFSQVDIVTYMTTKLVDDFASHLRLYRLTQTQLNQLKLDDPNANLLSIFFDLEIKMEKNICRDLVSEDNESCNIYLSHICDIVQYLLLPVEGFKNRPFRFLLRSILVKSILFPILDLLSDPDFINQTIVWLCRSYIATSDNFLTVIRCCNSSDELDAVRDIVNHEIAVLRSKDTGGQDDFEIKQQLSSLLFVKSTIESRFKCLNDGSFNDSDSTDFSTQIDWKNVKLFSLPFDVVLKNNIALSYFIEFMSSIGAQGYIYFYLNVEGFKISAEQQLSELQLIKLGQSESNHLVDLDSLKEAAINIFDTYLSQNATHKLNLDESISKKIYNRIHTETLSESWFDEAQNRIYDIMMNDERFFPQFKKTNHYIKLLNELDLLKESNEKNDEENENSIKTENSSLLSYDCDSLNSLEEDSSSNADLTLINPETISLKSNNSNNLDETTSLSTSSLSTFLSTSSSNESDYTTEIVKSGIIKESGNSYAAYVINITKKNEKWTILRRYSDFHSLHSKVLEKFPEIRNLSLPRKRTFNNMDKDFVEQRRHLLNIYLSQLLKISSNKQYLKDELSKFFQPGNYEKERFQFSKTVQNSFFNPLKSSVLSVGNAMKSGSENILDGLQRLGKMTSSISQPLSSSLSLTTSTTSSAPMSSNSLRFNNNNNNNINNNNIASSLPKSGANEITGLESSKVLANFDTEGEDNIPLRIMLLLMDEVFDLKHKNLWLRRRIVAFLRQIIQATFGNTINKKIIDFVEDLTCASSIAEYIKSFKNSFWPNGTLSQDIYERSHDTKMRTKIAAKMLLISSFSDELKHVIGNETTRRGLLFMFDMFQHEHLNKRLILTLFEGFLEELFPDNHFKQIFEKLHSKSQRIRESDTMSSNWPPYLYKFLGVEEVSEKQVKRRK